MNALTAGSSNRICRLANASQRFLAIRAILLSSDHGCGKVQGRWWRHEFTDCATGCEATPVGATENVRSVAKS